MDTVVKTGEPAPDFSLPDLDGGVHDLSDYEGKIIVINFWSTECPSAIRADEGFGPLLEEWGEEVALLSIASNANETHDQLIEAAAERSVSPVLSDADQAVANLYGAVTTPHIFVIDREGILRYQGAFNDVTFFQCVVAGDIMCFTVNKVFCFYNAITKLLYKENRMDMTCDGAF